MRKYIPIIVFASLVQSVGLKAQRQTVFHKMAPHTVYNINPACRAPLAPPIYDSIYYWNFDTTTLAWDYSSKEVKIVYNTGDKISSQLVQDWNGMSWINFTVDTFYFNANNSDTLDLEWAWTGSAWENEYMYSYTYNASDSVTSETEQIWTGSAWRNYHKFLYTFDANNNKTSLLELGWNGTNWVFGYKYVFVFDINNLETMEVDSTGASYNRWLYSYNNNNLLVTDTSQYWNGGIWNTDFNYFYTYNNNNLDTNETIQQWTGSAWENYEKFTYTYDGNGNNIGEMFSLWGTGWVLFQQYAFTYDANNYRLSEEEKQYFDQGSRVIIGDSIYWYFHKTTGIKEIADKSNLLIYPNPTKGIITIQNEAGQLKMENAVIQVYNTLGELVWCKVATLNSSYSIDLSKQPNGVYFLRIQGGQGVMDGKIVIEK